jgi:dTDP-glucose 4,6-dehydratase
LRVVVTGGAGFLGSHLCDRFLDEGYDVVAIDNLLTGNENNIAHLKNNPKFEFVHHDVSVFIELSDPVDAVLHFASPASPIDYLKYPIQTLKVGALGTHNALGLALAKNAKFLLASTSEVYGDPLVHPQPETYVGNVDTIGPRGVYDEAKRYAEAMTMAYHRVHALDTRIVRIFNTYGPRMRLDDGRVVPNFIGQALRGEPLTVYGDGSQTRSFQFVDDLIRGIWQLLHADYQEPVNIGNPHEMSILEFAHVVNQLTDNPGGIVYQDARIKGDPQTRQPDISLAKDVLQWQPQVDLSDGLQQTIEHFRKVV